LVRFLWWKAGIVGLIWLAFMGFGGWNLLETLGAGPILTQACVLLNFTAGAICLGIVYDVLVSKAESVRNLMPYFSMFGIIYFTTVTTAAGHDSLLTVGLLLLLVAILHNSAGYGLGYLFSRLLGLDPQSARAMALEVGLQNGGMASGLAGSMGMLGSLGLASAVFSPWMNISGSVLANYWKSNPPKHKTNT
jgi:BASS family bile acid:Na+ symporter